MSEHICSGIIYHQGPLAVLGTRHPRRSRGWSVEPSARAGYRDCVHDAVGKLLVSELAPCEGDRRAWGTRVRPCAAIG